MLEAGKYKIGDRLIVRSGIFTTNDRLAGKKEETEEVEVIGVYPHFVMVQNRKGTRWCPTNAELYAIKCEEAGIGDKRLEGKKKWEV